MNSTAINTVNQPTFWDVAFDYCREPIGIQRMVIQPMVRLFAWTEYLSGPLSKTARVAQKTFKHLNHFFYWLQYPRNITNFQKALIKLKNCFKKGSVIEIADQSVRTYVHGVMTVDLFADLLKILHNESIITLAGKVLQVVNFVGFLGSTALIVAGATGFIDRIKDLRSCSNSSPEYRWNVICLINRIALMAIGVIGVISFTGLFVVPTLATLIAPTVLLITALWAHFYHEMVVRNSVHK